MGIEGAVMHEAQEAACTTVGVVRNVVEKIWSVMDAAAEKPSPREYLSDRGIRSIQGMAQSAQKAVDASE